MACNIIAACWRRFLPIALCYAGLTEITPAATLFVTTAADSGPGSLRQAILDANFTLEADDIVFQISDPGTVKSIAILSTLPPISRPVRIDATTQSGYAGSPVVELNGTSAGESPALRVFSAGSTIRGLAINRFVAQGIKIDGGVSNWIAGNFIGTTPTGSASSANSREGIWVNNGQANMIGGTNAADRNVISGNGIEAGLYIIGGGRNIVQGNIIGLNSAGTAILGNGSHGLVISGSFSNSIGGSVPGAANVISGNTQSGIFITGATATGNVVQGNTIGLALDRTTTLANGGDGITILNANHSLIGGTNSLEANLVSGNHKAGIHISGTSAGNKVCGNKIGTDFTGRLAAGNSLAGVTLSGGSGNSIGSPGAGNLVSGNKDNGIFVSTNANGNTILANLVGLDATGTNKLPNLYSGIEIRNASLNIIGSTDSGAANVISGNAADGVRLTGGASNNFVAGNRIGTDLASTRALPNGPPPVSWPTNGFGIYIDSASGNSVRANTLSGNMQAGLYLGMGAVSNVIQANKIGTDSVGMLSISNYHEGIYLRGSSNNIIGGPVPADGNLISGNGTWGVSLTNSCGNTIQRNFLGTTADGVSALPNAKRVAGFHTIEIMKNASNNRITENVIAYTLPSGGTGYAGVRIRDGATNNGVLGNSFFGNSGLAVDSGAFGPSPNDGCDADSGANMLQNFPVLTQCVTGNGTGVKGTLQSKANSTFRIEFFASPACHSSGYGEGQIYLGSQDVTTDASCQAAFTASLEKSFPAGYRVTATATDASNNTSEFSPCAGSVEVPALAALRTGNSLQISWPENSAGFVLRQTDSLVPPVAWTPTTDPVSIVNGNFVLTVPMASSNRFYVLSFE